ncbi:sorting nexin-19 [Austrofundulus limnaeus]|uniref:Sorting nexin-19 n=1 Tax=Austrofundulus limnaeus TaxID=52670 RepID=A0A2I4D595_AUSLI|nr:PREDICTED: sorting nexin-19 [Austrofundulus limnaeus]
MAELLGQRSLLGFGVLLAWLLLFHLLVNIWLLCVFTSLLLVLGGWFGSQAILESNSLIHLERFIPLEQVQTSAEDEQRLDQEIHNTVGKIVKDFVTSWYSTVSSQSCFQTDVQEAMISVAMELKQRARRVDQLEVTEKVLNLLGSHVQDYLRAKELVTGTCQKDSEQLWKAYSSLSSPHLVMSSDAAELNYVRAVVDVLLHVLVPSPHLETHTGRFVVGELITCNVLLPFVDKLSDPDWLNLLIIEILGKSSTAQENTTTETQSLLSQPSETETAFPQEVAHVPQTDDEVPLQRAEVNHTDVAPDLPACDGTDSEDVDFPQTFAEEDESTEPYLRHYIRAGKMNPFYQENDSDLDSPLADYKQSSPDSLLMVAQEERDCASTAESNNWLDSEDVCSSPVDGSCPKVLVSSVLVEHPNDSGISSVRTAEGLYSISSLQDLDRDSSSSAVNPNRELLLGVDHANELAITSPLQGCSPLSTFSFEPLSSPEGPVIIQNLRITGTITAKEHRGTGSHPYTLYTIKYETSVGCDDFEAAGGETPPSIQPVAYHMVNRRYSEFLNLQTRLEEKTDLRKLIKGVKGPKKLFPDMPFGNMDSEKIEARKGLLETFLKHLCAIPEIANSEEMQEFLALNTDARIAFVKKPFIVSRIDKIVVNAIVGTLKTAFPRSEPQSPTEENEGETDGAKISMDKKSKSRLKLNSKNVPFLNGSDIRPPVLFDCDQNNTVMNGMSLGDLQTFITEQEKLSVGKIAEREDILDLEQHVGFMDPDMAANQSQEHGDMVLADLTLNILSLLMKQQWTWLCTENIQRTIRLLFGPLMNRWLDVSVFNLTSTRYWVVYLQVIQEAVWPGGCLPTAPPLKRSQQQKDCTRQQALDCLMNLLPDLVSDMLGSEKYKQSWQTALDSFQNPYINRHLVYCLFDLLLDFLVPELAEESFQRSLLQSLYKNPEKLMG